MTTPQIRAPRPFTSGDDFVLWIRRFESYASAMKIADDQMSAAVLALLDDVMFRAFDLLALADDDVKDFKKLKEALTKRFASSAGIHELRFLLGQRIQEEGETIDEFADALIHLANQAYPTMDTKLKMELARDRFVAGIKEEYIQESLLGALPETLDEAREKAKNVEAARTARRRMRTTTVTACTMVGSEATNAINVPRRELGCSDDSLAEAVRCNTEVLEKLLTQMNTIGSGRRTGRRSSRPPVCWQCGRQGHLQQNC